LYLLQNICILLKKEVLESLIVSFFDLLAMAEFP
jgi:hypothetical protein